MRRVRTPICWFSLACVLWAGNRALLGLDAPPPPPVNLDRIAEKLTDKDPHVRRDAVRDMSGPGGFRKDDIARAMDLLAGVLADDSEEVAATAAWQAGHLLRYWRAIGRKVQTRFPEAWQRLHDALVAAAGKPPVGVQGEALLALGQLRSESSRQVLLTALKAKQGAIRGAALTALARRKDEQAESAALAGLDDPDPSVRRHAIDALGRLHSVKAVPRLVKITGDVDRPDEAVAAVGSLSSIGGEKAKAAVIAALRSKNTRVRWQAARLASGADAVQPLIAALRDEDPDVREAAAIRLGHLGDKRAVKPLIAALDDPKRGIQRSAANALGDLGDASAVPALIAALDHDARMVVYRAAEALGRIGDKRAATSLRRLLKHKDASVRNAAAEALYRMGEPSPWKPPSTLAGG